MEESEQETETEGGVGLNCEFGRPVVFMAPDCNRRAGARAQPEQALFSTWDFR